MDAGESAGACLGSSASGATPVASSPWPARGPRGGCGGGPPPYYPVAGKKIQWCGGGPRPSARDPADLPSPEPHPGGSGGLGAAARPWRRPRGRPPSWRGGARCWSPGFSRSGRRTGPAEAGTPTLTTKGTLAHPWADLRRARRRRGSRDRRALACDTLGFRCPHRWMPGKLDGVGDRGMTADCWDGFGARRSGRARLRPSPGPTGPHHAAALGPLRADDNRAHHRRCGRRHPGSPRCEWRHEPRRLHQLLIAG